MYVDLYAFDENGRRLQPKKQRDVRCHSCGVKQENCPRGKPGEHCCKDCFHPPIVKVRSRPNPGTDILPAEPTPEEIERAEASHRKSKREKVLANLSPDELAVFELRKERVSRTQTRRIALEELERAIDQGWDLDHQESGEVIVTREVFMRPSYEQVGQKLGLTARQVHSRVVSIREKLKGAA